MSDGNPRPRINVRIGSLVVHGAAPGAGRALGAAVERQLGALLAAPGAHAQLAAKLGAHPGRQPSPKVFRLSAAGRDGAAIASAIARALHGGREK